MFGMIHQAARELTIDAFGVEAWEDVRRDLGMDESEFVSAQQNADERTFALVGAIAARAGLSIEDTLHAFGKFWVSYSERSTYAALMRMNGDTLPEFLENLDRMHTAIQMTMPDARMPSFFVRDANERGIDIVYQSERRGLEPFVVGLLEGLMARFQQAGEVAVGQESEVGVHFAIRYAA